jgi:UDP-MurNAc hydroxylase
VRVTWYTNACVRVTSSKGVSILCDPWINEGAFLGSWFHWPPISGDLANQILDEPCDGIYISHLHPDHYDPKFLSLFSKRRPEVPIYVANFAHPWLKRSICSVVDPLTRVIEVPPLAYVDFGQDFKMQLFAADTCNPKICGANVPCQANPSLRGIDSIAVFSSDGYVVVNANDAMGVELVPRIVANVGKADLLMGHYGGASPFPQCFPEVENKKLVAREVVQKTCRMLIQAAEALNVRYVMPFAGQYVLGGRLVALNQDRATIPLDLAANLLRTITEREVITLTPGGTINLKNGEKCGDYIEPNTKQLREYLESIKKVKFPYEEASSKNWNSTSLDLINSAKPLAEKSKFAKIKLRNSFVIGDGENFVTINIDPNQQDTSVESGNCPRFDTVTEISMPTELLRRLSTRKRNYKGFTTLHWNQADVGSHFLWRRKGEFELASHSLLNFYGT